MAEVADVADAAVRMALKQNVEVVVVRNSDKLAEAGYVVALLRY